MHSRFDDDVLTPDQRLSALATIFASGLLRLRDRAAILDRSPSVSTPGNLAESRQDCLEFVDETRLTVHEGYRPSDLQERSDG